MSLYDELMDRDELIHKQQVLIDSLRAMLNAAGIDTAEEIPAWAEGLNKQQRALVGALFRAYPRVVHRYVLLDELPSRDHVVERSAGLVDKIVHDTRKRVGHAAIVSVRGEGWRLGDAYYKDLAGIREAA